MKITTDYVIGNTAIQIVNTGKRIKIVDVEKRARKKRFWKRCCVTLLTGMCSAIMRFFRKLVKWG